MKGATIRHRLAQVGMTQVELARLLGVTPQTVNKMLYSSNLQTGTLERICEVLHLPILFFYDENNEAMPTVTIEEKEVDIDSVPKFWQTCHIGDKVKSLLRSQHKKFAVLYRHIGMTDAGLRRAFDRDSC